MMIGAMILLGYLKTKSKSFKNIQYITEKTFYNKMKKKEPLKNLKTQVTKK